MSRARWRTSADLAVPGRPDDEHVLAGDQGHQQQAHQLLLVQEPLVQRPAHLAHLGGDAQHVGVERQHPPGSGWFTERHGI